jgi:hypothetical protein
MQALALSKGGRCLSKTYVNVNTKLRWQCDQQHIWESTLGNVNAGSWCKVCRREKEKAYWLAEMQAMARARGGRWPDSRGMSA